MLKKRKADLENFTGAIKHEWLETNGLGGWASSSIIGAHTRRYHGLLVASIVPPAQRVVLLSKLDETVLINERRHELGCNLYPSNTIHPAGHSYLESFTRELFPQWLYKIDGVQLKKTIAMVHGENTTVIRYDVIKASSEFTLELQPFIAARGYHSLAHESPALHWDVDFDKGVFHNTPDGNIDLYICVPGADYFHSPVWYKNFQYTLEKYRGLDFNEDLLNHGKFHVSLKEGDSLGIIISTENPANRNAHELLERETQRRQKLLSRESKDDVLRQLILAADQFIVKKDDNLKTVIAGYHWFTDWGRDTMISMPGLCLSTGRFDDAKKILSAFSKSVDQGMLPNRFQDNGEAPEYNNVDGTLWYFIAVHKYLQATGDNKFVINDILPVLKEIIGWHLKGTRYNIHADNDGLLYAGVPGQQLTWMDARIGTWVVTPRIGKPVEIQALWYNALKIFAELLQLNKESEYAEEILSIAEKAKVSFNEKFWFPEGNYLFDVIDEQGLGDDSLRPNQLFAISLPFRLIEGEKAKAVLKIVSQQLYTPVGLKSLSTNDRRYVPLYGGDQWHRDSSYHQGTVWSWLLGPYIDAIFNTQGLSARLQAEQIIHDFKYHLNEGCIGSVSEIFDANYPHLPKGCVAQAWGVAEILRVIKEYELLAIKKKSPKKKTITTDLLL